MYLKATAKLAQFKEEYAKGPDATVAKAFPRLASLGCESNLMRSSRRIV